MAIEIDNPRCCARRHLRAIAIGVGTVARSAIGMHPIFVGGADAHAWNKKLPDTRWNAPVHVVGAAIPAIEVADNTYAGGVGGPDSEVDAIDAID